MIALGYMAATGCHLLARADTYQLLTFIIYPIDTEYFARLSFCWDLDRGGMNAFADSISVQRLKPQSGIDPMGWVAFLLETRSCRYYRP